LKRLYGQIKKYEKEINRERMIFSNQILFKFLHR